MSALQDIIDLYGKGGIEVTTFAGTEDTSVEQRPLIRTVIQPNASLITWVHPGKESERVLEKHHEALQSHLKSIKSLRQRLRSGGLVAVLASVLSLNAITAEFDVSLVIRLLVSAAAAILLRYLFRYGIFFTFRWYIRRKIQKHFSTLTG